MLRRLFASAAAAFALLFVVATFDTADARKGGNRGFSGARSSGFSARSGGMRFSGGHRHSGRHFRGRNLIIGAGVPLAFGTYYYGSGDGCYWLKRRALATGSGYWWDRYDNCVNGY